MRRQQGRKKTRKIKEWQREVKETKENKRETRKGDTWKWTKITLHQGEKQCLSPNKKNEGLKANCPKTTCAMRRCPQSQEECEQKKKKHLNRKKGVWRGPLEVLRKKGSNKKNGKDAKTPPHRSGNAIFANDTKPDRKIDAPARTPRVKFARAPDTTQEKRFCKRPRLCSPNAFLNLKNPIFVKKIELLKVEK